MREAIIGFLAGDTKKGNEAKATKKEIGEYCKGADVEECRRYFGNQLRRICASCPN